MSDLNKKIINALLAAPIIIALILVLFLSFERLNNNLGYEIVDGNVLGISSDFLQLLSGLGMLVIVISAITLIVWLFRLLSGAAGLPLLKIYSADTILVDNQTKKAIYFPEEVRLWRWVDKKLYAGMSKYHFMVNSVYEEFRHIRPITANPKVRDITYTVDFEIKPEFLERTEESIQRRIDSLGANWDKDSISVPKDIRSALYEFSEKNSKELAELYNPENPEQQSKFDGLLKGWMADKLSGSPFLISVAKFSLN